MADRNDNKNDNKVSGSIINPVKRGSKNRQETDFRSQTSTYLKGFEVNEKEAQKAYEKVFGYAKGQASAFSATYEKDSKKTTGTIVDSMSSGYSDIFGNARKEFKKFDAEIKKTSISTIAEITKGIENSYNKMYQNLISQHSNYLANIAKLEGKTYTAPKIQQMQSTNTMPQSEQEKLKPKMKITQYFDRNQEGKKYRVTQANENKEFSFAKSKFEDFYKAVSDFENQPKDFKGVISKKTNDDFSKLQKDLKDNLRKGLISEEDAIRVFNASAGKYESASLKLTVASEVFELAVDSISLIIKLWVDRFKTGISNIYNEYERSFQKVSVLLGEDQKSYMQFQTETLSTMKDMGVGNNIALSSVMAQYEKTVSMGITDSSVAQGKAISDSINKVIAPFVDTMTNAYTDLQFKLGTPFVESISSMGDSLTKQVGSSRVFASSINTIIDKLEPIMLNSKAQYAEEHLGPAMAALEQAVQSGSMTHSQAVDMAYGVNQISDNPYSALTGGNTALAMAAMKSTDPTSMGANMLAYGEVGQDVMGSMSGADVFGRSAANTIIGFIPHWSTDYTELNKDLIQGSTGYKSGDYKEIYDRFADDSNTTATELKAIRAENASLKFAQFKQQYPDMYAVSEKILSAVVSISKMLIFNAGFKALGKMLGGELGAKLTGNFLPEAGKKVGEVISKKLGGETLKKLEGKVVQKVGTKVATTGTSAALGTVAGATVGVTGAVLSGKEVIKLGKGGLGEKEKKDTVKSAVGYGTGAVAGGGAVAAFALVSNPVGWILTAVGAVAIGTTALVKSMDKNKGALKDINKMYDEQSSAMKDEHKERVKLIKDLKKEKDNLPTGEKRKIMEDYTGDKDTVDGWTDAAVGTKYEEMLDFEKDKEKIAYKTEKSVLKELKTSQKTELEKALPKAREELSGMMDNMTVDEKEAVYINLGFSEKKAKKYAKKDKTKKYINKANLTVDNFTEISEIYGLDSDFKDKKTLEEDNYEYTELKTIIDTYNKLTKDGKILNKNQQSEYDEAQKTLKSKYKNSAPTILGTFAQGSSYLSNDGLVYGHKGEGVLTKTENQAFGELARQASMITQNPYKAIAQALPQVSMSLLNSQVNSKWGSDSSAEDSIATGSNDIVEAIKVGISEIISMMSKTVMANGVDNDNKKLPRPPSAYTASIINLESSLRSM